MNRPLIALTLVAALVGCGKKPETPQPVIHPLEFRAEVLKMPGGLKCDFDNWPKNDECQNLEQSIGAAIMRTAKEADKSRSEKK